MSDEQRRVAIDVSAIPADPRGAGRYVVELVAALHRRNRTALRLVARRGDHSRWEQLAPSATVDAIVPASRAARLVWEQTAASSRVRRWPIEVYHGPHYTMPSRLSVPRVVTVHDLTFFDHPEWHERSKVSFFRRAIRHAAADADTVICVSDATRRRLVELLDPVAPTVVVPHGIDHDRFTPNAEPGDANVLDRLGASRPYLLFLGTMEPRKNVAGLVAAFDLLADDHPDMGLVLAGGRGWGEERLHAAVAGSRAKERIVQTGYVADDDVPVMLRHAAAVVYPAFVEGFGLPALEALACGTPVVTTSGSVMEELAGGAAFTSDASDASAMAAVIRHVLDGGLAVDEARALGLEVASRFTWDNTAALHEQVYAEAAQRRL
ncbi:MAG: glycosyltransferase family 4 protein [Acidimicrobiales bacterium]